MTGTKIGALRHRLQLEEPVRQQLDGGGATVSWTPVSVVWGEIIPRSGREIVLGDGVKAFITHEILIRHHPLASNVMRFVSPGRTFDIHAVMNVDGEYRWQKCLCEERIV
jgi:SPP1 family predicted phage head-tail adaptor